MNNLRAAIYNQINLHTVSGSNENLETYSDLNSNSAISQGFLAKYKIQEETGHLFYWT